MAFTGWSLGFRAGPDFASNGSDNKISTVPLEAPVRCKSYYCAILVCCSAHLPLDPVPARLTGPRLLGLQE